MTNAPSPPLRANREAPLALVSVTVAEGTTAPDGSATVPRMLPVWAWAERSATAKKRTRPSKLRQGDLRRSLFVMMNPFDANTNIHPQETTCGGAVRSQ